MFSATHRNRAVAALSAAAVLALVSGSAQAEPDCTTASGKVRLAPVSGAECTSPVGMCFAGELTGGLNGTAFTTATSITPTVDTPQTSVVLFTADSVVTTHRGTLDLKETVLLQTEGGEFSELSMVVGGTGRWEDADGVFRVDGNFDGSTVTGRYQAEICRS